MSRGIDMGPSDKTSSYQQGSHNATRSSKDPPTRRKSRTMRPPTSADFRLPQAEISTTATKTTTPTVLKNPMDSTSAGPIRSPDKKTSTLTGHTISSDGKDITVQMAASPRVQPFEAHNFMSFAQSIVSTTTLNMKLENLRGVALENVKESRRLEKHNIAYASLVELTSADYGAIQKASMRLEKQCERCNTDQDLIANTLQAYHAKALAVPSNVAAVTIDLDVPNEIAKLQEELQKVRTELAEQRNIGATQKDLEKFAHYASLDDLKNLITKEELLDVMSKPSARPPELEGLHTKVSDLAHSANEHHREAQETQNRVEKQLKDLDVETTAARNKGQEKYTKTQIKLAKIWGDLGTLKEGSSMQTKQAGLLEKSIDGWKEDSVLLKEELKQIHTSQTRLEAVVHGESTNGESGLCQLTEKALEENSQWKILMEQLQEKIAKLEEGAKKDSPQQQSVPIGDIADSTRHIDSIRQHLAEVTGATDELKQELYEIVVDVDKLRQGLIGLRDEFDRSKSGLEKQQLQLIQPAQLQVKAIAPALANIPASLEDRVPIRLEKVENSLQALGVFTNSLQLRFDNLTTEELARNIIYQMKRLYNEHPGHTQDKLRTIEEQQRVVDTYITSNLQPRLAQIDTRISGRAGMDALQILNTRVQSLEATLKEAVSYTFQTRKDVSASIANVTIPREQGPHDIRTHEDVITFREELREMKVKHAELVDVVMTRHGKLRKDVQNLNQIIYAEAAGNPHKQAKLRESMEYTGLMKHDLDDLGGTKDAQSIERAKGIKFRTPVAPVSSNHQEDKESARNGLQSTSDDESDAPMMQLQKRKRKRQSLSDTNTDEKVDDNNIRRRASRSGPQ